MVVGVVSFRGKEGAPSSATRIGASSATALLRFAKPS